MVCAKYFAANVPTDVAFTPIQDGNRLWVRFLTIAACGRKRTMARLQACFSLRPVSSVTVSVSGEKLQPFLMVFV